MKIIKSDLTKEELQYIHEVLLFQRLLDHKRRNKIDQIRNKILSEINWIDMKEKFETEDKEDNIYRRKITK